MGEKREEKEKVFICYLNDDGKRIEAHVELIEISESWIRIKTGKNEITLPSHRVLKLKKEVKNE